MTWLVTGSDFWFHCQWVLRLTVWGVTVCRYQLPHNNDTQKPSTAVINAFLLLGTSAYCCWSENTAQLVSCLELADCCDQSASWRMQCSLSYIPLHHDIYAVVSSFTSNVALDWERHIFITIWVNLHNSIHGLFWSLVISENIQWLSV